MVVYSTTRVAEFSSTDFSEVVENYIGLLSSHREPTMGKTF